jgi:xanthine/CO dehydrogenase XdhC/CoxF family maturation factor
MNTGETSTEPTFLDGNAAAGELRELFAVDVTAALAQCVGCGRVMRLAETRLYGPAPGLVLRCPGCEAVLVRLVTTTDRAWLDMRGLAYVELRG